MKKTMLQNERVKLGLVVITLILPAVAAVLVFLASKNGIVSNESIQLALDLLSLLFAFYISLFTGYLSWRALIFATVPRIEMKYLGEDKTGRLRFNPKETVSLSFQMTNIGWWYAKPPSTNTNFFLNFPSSFSLIQARFGSQKELETKDVKRGKDNSNYFWIKGVHLYHGEPSEEIVIDVRLPEEAGIYKCRISAFSEQTAYGIYPFSIDVTN